MPARANPSPTQLASVAASRALLTVGAVAGVAAALVAAAPVHRPAAHRTPARQEDVDRVLRAAGATGPAWAVWAPNPAARTGDPGAEPLLPTFTWVAVVGDGTPDGARRGTVTARQTGDGARSLTVTATDDDVDLAGALGVLEADEVLVADGGDWLAVRGDHVRPLLRPAPAAAPDGPRRPLTVPDLHGDADGG